MSGTLYLKLVAALAPAVVLAMIMIRRDKARPEPRRWLLGAAGLGVAAAGIVLLLGWLGILKSIPVETFGNALENAFLMAAIPEELVKFAMLVLIANRCRHFDEYFDGIVYAVCIGMGFAGLENILYVFGDDNWLVISVMRALLAVPAHYCFAIIMGAFFSRAFFNREGKTRNYLLALFFPIVVHGLYDTLCFSLVLNEYLTLGILILFLIFFRRLRKYTRKLSDATLSLDSEQLE